MKTRVGKAQRYLQERQLDGWLLYDFHRNNELAYQFLRIPAEKMTTRRFFYWIPAKGEPVKIVHAIESNVLDAWPGEKRVYSSWQSLESELKRVLKGQKKVAMEYSPKAMIPYVSKVDAGTVDLVRSFGVEVVSSADFLLYFTAVLSDAQMDSQRRAATALAEIVEGAWKWIREHLAQATERSVQQWIEEQCKSRGLVSDSPPIVAVNAHSADPHFETPNTGSSPIRKGDLALIDLWAKEPQEGAVFGDLTKVAVIGAKPTE